MMEAIASALGAVNGARELAGGLRREAMIQPANGSNNTKYLQRILDVLREIYFEPSGTRAVLEIVADGGWPDQELISGILPEFNDFEDRWDRHRDGPELEFASLRELGFQARETLHRIKVGKGGVRKRVQELLNESLTFDHSISVDVATELLEAIRSLNSEISLAEEWIMNAMKDAS